MNMYDWEYILLVMRVIINITRNQSTVYSCYNDRLPMCFIKSSLFSVYPRTSPWPSKASTVSRQLRKKPHSHWLMNITRISQTCSLIPVWRPWEPTGRPSYLVCSFEANHHHYILLISEALKVYMYDSDIYNISVICPTHHSLLYWKCQGTWILIRF